MRRRHFIDTHKFATGLAVLGLMTWYDQWDNPTAWVYLGTHGTYGLLWVWKSRVFPDKSWERQCSLLYGLFVWAGLTLYWIAPWLITSRSIEAPPWVLGACVALSAAGVFLHFAADMQKHTHLQLRPGELFTDGLWSRCRNPNYVGELMIYLGFGLLAMHWLPVAVLLLFVIVVWIPNMLRKERSLSRYPEFDEYRSRSWMFLPFVY